MIAVSTALRSEVTRSGKEIIEAILDLGLNRVELEYRITESMLKEILSFWRRGEIEVVSVHNFFPRPEEIPENAPSIPDYFALSSPDPDERKRALKYAKRTIEWAEELGARAVVFHLGKIPMGEVMKELKKLYDAQKMETAETKNYIQEQKKIREEKGQAYLPGALRSLDVLAAEAEKRKLGIGLECRYNLIDFPNLAEFQIIFKEFAGSPIGYWHDVGHAAAQERLGLTPQKEFLEHLGPWLIGTHLHGCNGYEDHEAPGKGEVDLETLRKFLKPQTLRVIETHHRATKKELLEGIEFLKEKGMI
jgi:sugar phosphate isomerase/epimerase